MKTLKSISVISAVALLSSNVNAGFSGYELDGTMTDLMAERYTENGELGSNIEKMQEKQATKDEIALALRSCANSIAVDDSTSNSSGSNSNIGSGENLSNIGTGENIENLGSGENIENFKSGETVDLSQFGSLSDGNEAVAPVMQTLYNQWSANRGTRRNLAIGDGSVVANSGGNKVEVTEACEEAFTQAEEYATDSVQSLASAKNALGNADLSAPKIKQGASTEIPTEGMDSEEITEEDVFIEEEEKSQEELEKEITCYHFEKDGKGLSLCVEPSEVIIPDGTETEYVSLVGEIENTGVKDLCNVTLSVPSLDEAIEASSTTIPDNFSPSETFSYRYVIPIDPESHSIPQVDIWSTFYTCLPPKEIIVEEEVEEEVVEVEEEEEEIEEEVEEEVVEEVEEVEVEEEIPVKSEDTLGDFFDQDSNCFKSCIDGVLKDQMVKEEKEIDYCIALNYIFNNKCHSCNRIAIEAAQLQCIDYGCSDEECIVEEKKTSGSSMIQVSTFMLGLSVAAIMYIA